MATTDTKPGFRLPWSSERTEPVNPTDVARTRPRSLHRPGERDDRHDRRSARRSRHRGRRRDVGRSESVTNTAEPEVVVPTAVAPAPPTGRKPNKFMADLTKAMQAAAETAREDTLGGSTRRRRPISRTSTPRPRSRPPNSASRPTTTSRPSATGPRPRSPGSARRPTSGSRTARRRSRARSRSTPPHRAAHRARPGPRGHLRERDGRSSSTVCSPRTIPTRFAAMAESLPEPPPFDGEAHESHSTGVAAAVVDAVAEPIAHVEPAPAEASTDVVADPVEAPVADPVEAAVETAPETVDASQDGGDLFGMSADAPAEDPRLSALGMTPDFAAAEAEAATFSAPTDGEDDDVPVIADDALAARLADLVPDGETHRHDHHAPDVTGLVSVASIAGFKRHLSRVAGVQSVGVSSGPDGEFVFAVTHGPDDRPSRRRSRRCRVRAPRHGRVRRRADGRRARSRAGEIAMARPAVVIALPPDEATPVATELRDAGFPSITVTQPGPARSAPDQPSRRRGRDPGWRDRFRSVRSSTTGCSATVAAPSRRSWSSRRAPSSS